MTEQTYAAPSPHQAGHVSYGKAVQDELRLPARELRHAIPDVYAGFRLMHDNALQDGALSRKHKELMAFAISTALRCDGCIASHARGAANAGATLEEAAEAVGVTILMQGGPSTVYGPRAYAAFQEFYEEARARAQQP